MKKNFLKKAVSIAVASAMMVMPLNAFATTTVPAQSSKDAATLADVTVTGKNTVVNPIYKVTLPSTLTVAIDAFEIGTAGVSIASNDYVIVNKSNVGVVVGATVKAELKDTTGMSFVVDAATAKAAATKAVFLTMNLGNALDTGADVTHTATKPVWAPNAEADAIVALTATESKKWFALDKALYTDGKITGLDGTKNYGGFYFEGAVATHPEDANGNALAWAAGDLTISAVFSLDAYTASEFTELVADSSTNKNAKALNVYDVAPAIS